MPSSSHLITNISQYYISDNGKGEYSGINATLTARWQDINCNKGEQTHKIFSFAVKGRWPLQQRKRYYAPPLFKGG